MISHGAHWSPRRLPDASKNRNRAHEPVAWEPVNNLSPTFALCTQQKSGERGTKRKRAWEWEQNRREEDEWLKSASAHEGFKKRKKKISLKEVFTLSSSVKLHIPARFSTSPAFHQWLSHNHEILTLEAGRNQSLPFPFLPSWCKSKIIHMYEWNTVQFFFFYKLRKGTLQWMNFCAIKRIKSDQTQDWFLVLHLYTRTHPVHILAYVHRYMRALHVCICWVF